MANCFSVIVVQFSVIEISLCCFCSVLANSLHGTCHDMTNLKLTSSRIIFVVSPNSYTSKFDIAGAVKLGMLSERTQHTIHIKTSFSNNAAARYMDIICMEDFFKYTEMSIASEEVFHSRFSKLHFASELGHSAC